MNTVDLVIIYFTCAAPLAVFYFLQNRRRQNSPELWLKTFFTVIFWLPFGLRLLNYKLSKEFFAGKNKFIQTGKSKTELLHFPKYIETLLAESDLQISIFQFRQTVERYVELTFASGDGSVNLTETEKEVFQVAKSIDVELGAICLNRRNRKRLSIHQNRARRDFFLILNQIIKFVSDEEEFSTRAAKFFRLINDVEAQSLFKTIISENFRNKTDFAIDIRKNYLPDKQIRKSSVVKSTALQMQTLPVAANSSIKD